MRNFLQGFSKLLKTFLNTLELQCDLDIVTLNLVTTSDLVTIFLTLFCN